MAETRTPEEIAGEVWHGREVGAGLPNIIDRIAAALREAEACGRGAGEAEAERLREQHAADELARQESLRGAEERGRRAGLREAAAHAAAEAQRLADDGAPEESHALAVFAQEIEARAAEPD